MNQPGPSTLFRLSFSNLAPQEIELILPYHTSLVLVLLSTKHSICVMTCTNTTIKLTNTNTFVLKQINQLLGVGFLLNTFFCLVNKLPST